MRTEDPENACTVRLRPLLYIVRVSASLYIVLQFLASPTGMLERMSPYMMMRSIAQGFVMLPLSRSWANCFLRRIARELHPRALVVASTLRRMTPSHRGGHDAVTSMSSHRTLP